MTVSNPPRLLTADEPNEIWVSDPDWTGNVADLLRHQFRLGVVANLLTRSDYVVPLFGQMKRGDDSIQRITILARDPTQSGCHEIQPVFTP